MDPIRRSEHDFTYKGPTPEIGDLSCFREGGAVWSHWKPTPEELNMLVSGGQVALGLYAEPIPPISMEVVPAEPENGSHT